ncbi:MAG TPA: transketolase C-terminal domain-containing protein, partial [Rubrivivax sp.]|nr:transketolase C-terminal domain-containing protein [Rubrivivax sp.]
ADGATHCGAFDIAYIRCVPNLSLIAPADEAECRRALTTAFRQDHPVAVRYPRGTGVGAAVEPALDELPWGKAEQRRRTTRTSAAGGPRVAILAFGTLLYPALQAADALDASVFNMRFVKPLDAEAVLQAARSHEALVTIEEGAVMGGAGSAVAECLAANGIVVPLLQLGLPDHFVEHGDPAQLLAQCGLDAEGIVRAIQQRYGSRLTVLRPVAAC